MTIVIQYKKVNVTTILAIVHEAILYTESVRSLAWN